jgi:hypothetical protein
VALKEGGQEYQRIRKVIDDPLISLNEDAFGARVEHDATTEANATSSFVTSISKRALLFT